MFNVVYCCTLYFCLKWSFIEMTNKYFRHFQLRFLLGISNFYPDLACHVRYAKRLVVPPVTDTLPLE